MSTNTDQPKSSPSPLKLYIAIQAILAATMLIVGGIELGLRGEVYKSSTMPYLGWFDLVGVYAFGTLAVHVLWQWKFSWRQRCLTTVVYLGVYVLSYGVLSMAGDYHASRSGKHRWQGAGLAVVDQDIWHAKGVFWQPFVTMKGEQTTRASVLGRFYSPWVRIDRRLWHDSFDYQEDDLEEWLAAHPDVR